MKRALAALTLLLTALPLPAAEPARLHRPYGVVSHITGTEKANLAKHHELLLELGAQGSRDDYIFHHLFDAKTGKLYPFTAPAKNPVYESCRKNGLDHLPILIGSYKGYLPVDHEPEWRSFVRGIALLYHEDFKYYEIGNEQNSEVFFGKKPDAALYVNKMLRPAYEELKKVDPAIRVVSGGLSGVPFPYIEAMLKAGAANYFDVFAVHPYNTMPENNAAILKKLNALLKKYGCTKPVWATECGIASPKPTARYHAILPAALSLCGIDPAKSGMAVVGEAYGGVDLNSGVRSLFPPFKEFRQIKPGEIASLNVKRYPVLLASARGHFPAKYAPALKGYVKRGGTLLFPSELPLYYLHETRPDGTMGPKVIGGGPAFKGVEELHVSWTTWWKEKGVPKVNRKNVIPDNLKGQVKPCDYNSMRYLSNKALKNGDRFIPLMLGGDASYTGATAALYKLNSDLKGNIIVLTGVGVRLEAYTEETQAQYVPRCHLIAFANGISRLYWYNLRANEKLLYERGSHWGLVHADHRPKPAFYAYQTMTKMLPDGSTVPVVRTFGKVWTAAWRKTDGTPVCAVWTADEELSRTFTVRGAVKAFYDLYGKPLNVKMINNKVTLKATPSVIYAEGAASLIPVTSSNPRSKNK